MIYLAPLHGITLYPFRNCFFKYFKGVDVAITPFIAAIDELKLNTKTYQDVLPEYNDIHKIIPQILGHHKAALKQSCLHLKTLGYRDINWNLGCPSKQVIRHGRGCAMLKHSETIADILDDILKIEDLKFSLKIRLGEYDTEESKILIRRLRHYPLNFIIVHPRLGIEEYRGSPNLEMMQYITEIATQEIIYNGDIFSLQDFTDKQQHFPKIKNWMIGRGLLRNPFLAEEIKHISSENRNQRFSDFLDEYQFVLLNGRLSERGVLSHFKELWRYYAYYFNISQEEIRLLLQTNTLSEFNFKIQKFL